jgi:hypothetical protein
VRFCRGAPSLWSNSLIFGRSKFFGKPTGGNAPKPQQSKLAFSSSAKSKKEKDEIKEEDDDVAIVDAEVNGKAKLENEGALCLNFRFMCCACQVRLWKKTPVALPRCICKTYRTLSPRGSAHDMNPAFSQSSLHAQYFPYHHPKK